MVSKSAAALWFALLCILSQAAGAQQNVVLVTLDGVRHEEFFAGADPALSNGNQPGPIFAQTLKRARSNGLLLGDPRTGAAFHTSNAALVSLPGYHSILSGRYELLCISNECGRPLLETMPERLLRELKLPAAHVATFTTSALVAQAVERRPGTTHVSVGTGDADTFHAALRHLDRVRPRFLYIALDDADSAAHRGDYPAYVATLRTYDQYIERLLRALESMGEYGRQTSVFVTTDHGRGQGEDWTEHNIWHGHARRVWLALIGGKACRHRARKSHTHASIRPTIERLFGLEPRTCALCAAPIEEAVCGR